jgi:phenylalanyl-tRNA synthetase beta chain
MTLPKIKIKNINVDKREHMKERVNRILHGYGLFEVYTFPFVNEDDIRILNINKNNLYKINNPMTKELEFMSNEPIISLLKITETNLKRRNDLVKIYEWGRTYSKKNGEEKLLSLLLTGEVEKSIYSKSRDLDYFDIKAILDHIVSNFNLDNPILEKESRSLWDDSLAYSLKVNEKVVLEFGKINSDIVDYYDIESSAWGLYLYINNILDYYNISREYKEYSFFPPVYFDLAFIVDKKVKSGEILELIKEKAGEDLESVRLFDVYEGKPLEKNKKSLAYSLVFRSLDKTLSEKDVNDRIENVIEEVKEKFNAKMRE